MSLNLKSVNSLRSHQLNVKTSVAIECFFQQVHAVIGVLTDDTDPMVTVMKLEKAPQESYADIGGLDKQIMEIKVIIKTKAKFTQ